ncbi:hypothetical protein TrLO_g12364 [Triparma laevis f. longispina]|uniref:Major facilitator superfamily (MFS) profile domain-containing protein n=1 Tax=Triparma laevis f. longispina TaxID=1714387 RepID=A0A9W7KRJ4_9STRA|nr:hypothetical protein TrLO_g12364 [Triparma laevis f. longispina]
MLTGNAETSPASPPYLLKYLLLLNLLLYLEAGAVPALLLPLTEQFQMNQLTTGLMGGIVYLSISLGGPIAGLLLKPTAQGERRVKEVVMWSLAFNNAATLFFGLTPRGNVWLLVVARGLIGFTQVVVCVYSPLWVDSHSPPDMRARCMSYLQASVPLGVMGGYVLATVSSHCTWFGEEGRWASEDNRWRWPFILQFLAVTPMIIGLFFVPDKHIQLAAPTSASKSRTNHHTHTTGILGPDPTEIILATATLATVPSYGSSYGSVETDSLLNSIQNSSSPPRQNIISPNTSLSNFSPRTRTKMSRSALHKEAASVFSPYKSKDILVSTHESCNSLTGLYNDEIDAISTTSAASFSLPPSDANLWTCLVALMKSPVYVCLTWSLASLYFTVTGVQYWGTAYMKLVLNGNPAVTSSLFIGVAATGPVLGVFCGGWAVDKLGGYRGYECRNRTMKLCCCLGLASCVFGFPSVFVTNLYLFAGLLWLMLFFGGAVLPGCTGVAVSVIPRQFRPISSSVSLVVFNLFGYSLSLILSGAIMQIAANNIAKCDYTCSLRYGFMSVIFWSAWSLLFLFAAIIFSMREKR